MLPEVANVLDNKSLMAYLTEWLCHNSMESLSLTCQNAHWQDILHKRRAILPWRAIFPPRLITTEELFRIPMLDIGNNRGHTGYIDFVSSVMMRTGVMKGIDAWRRPFMVFRFAQEGRSGVLSMFRRYTDASSIWVTAGASILGYEGVCVVSDQHPLIDIAKNLLVHGECSYEYSNVSEGPPIVTSLRLVN